MRFTTSLSLSAVLALVCACSSSGPNEDEGGEFEAHLLECDAPTPCALLSYQSYAPPNPPSLPSTAELQCAIDALDAREPATIVVSSGCEGVCAGDVYLVRTDGTALRQTWFDEQGTGPIAALPGYGDVNLSDWAGSGELCDLVPVGSCTPETCPYPSDWVVDCRPAQTNQCQP